MNINKVKIALPIIGVGLFILWHHLGGNKDAQKSSVSETKRLLSTTDEKDVDKKDEQNRQKKFIYGLLKASERSKADDIAVEETAEETNLSPVELTRNEIRNSVISEQFLNRAPELLDQMLAGQKKNSTWTDVVTRRLTEQLQKLPDKQTGALKEVNCYETICKFVTIHESMDFADKFYMEANEYSELDGPGHRFSKKIGNNFTSVSYMARAGENRVIHDDLYNKMYEDITGEKVEDIEPTDDQINSVLAAMQSSTHE